MTRSDSRRHMSAREVALAAEWIRSRPTPSTWAEIKAHVLREFGIVREVEALRRIPELKAARTQRAALPTRRRSGLRPTARKLDSLEAEIRRLDLEILRLEQENAALLARNLRLCNGGKMRRLSEHDLDRPLAPISRNPTYLPDGKKGK